MPSDDDVDEDDGDGAEPQGDPPSPGTASREKPVPYRPTEQTRAYLRDLVEVGVFGKNPTAVVSRLVDDGIRRAIGLGLIERRRP